MKLAGDGRDCTCLAEEDHARRLRRRGLISLRSVAYLSYLAFGRSTAARCCVSLLCQLRHIRKKRRRLANEKPHVRQKRESTHGNAIGLGRADDRTAREPSPEERTRLWHDQVRLEEFAAKWRRIQIRECHGYPCHWIDSSQGWRI